jgi:hypothetical protein
MAFLFWFYYITDFANVNDIWRILIKMMAIFEKYGRKSKFVQREENIYA